MSFESGFLNKFVYFKQSLGFLFRNNSQIFTWLHLQSILSKVKMSHNFSSCCKHVIHKKGAKGWSIKWKISLHLLYNFPLCSVMQICFRKVGWKKILLNQEKRIFLDDCDLSNDTSLFYFFIRRYVSSFISPIFSPISNCAKEFLP